MTAFFSRGDLAFDGNSLFRGLIGNESADGYPSQLNTSRPWNRI